MKNELVQRLAVRSNFLKCRQIGETFANAVERRGRCHDNVKEYLRLEENMNDRRVWGWLINQDELENTGAVIFAAHSIVQCKNNGEYLDITLWKNQSHYKFLSCELNEADFDQLVIMEGNNQLPHVVNPALHKVFLDALNNWMPNLD